MQRMGRNRSLSLGDTWREKKEGSESVACDERGEGRWYGCGKCIVLFEGTFKWRIRDHKLFLGAMNYFYNTK